MSALNNSVSASHWKKKVCRLSFVHVIGELNVHLSTTLLLVGV